MIALALLALPFSAAKADLTYYGVNLTGAEYGLDSIPGVYNTDYTYPTDSEVDYFMGTGMNTFRVPFSWERMQPTLGGALDLTQLGYMDAFINYATAQGASVILDPHNFAAYDGQVIGAPGSSVTTADFDSLWSQLAAHYASNSHVIFGLMNEPVGTDDGGGRPGGTTEQWLTSANDAIGAIRSAGASNLILVPGNGYDGAGNWSANFYGTSNSSVMGGVVDPDNNFAYEVHLYFDDDGSGTSSAIANNDPNIGVERLADFTLWLEANNAKGFLGEFGAANGPLPEATVDNTLKDLQANSSVWLGWTYWDAGPWPSGDAFSIDPSAPANGELSVLENNIPVPEPGTLWLFAAALPLLALGHSRRPAA